MEKNGTIYIRSCRLIENDDATASLVYSIDVKETHRDLYFKFSKNYKDYACENLADGVVVILLSYAMRGGYDIESAVPVSGRLYYSIMKQLIPQLYYCTKNVYKPVIKAPLSQERFSPTGVGTAISCGVDSLTTLKEYTVDCKQEEYRLTLLTFYQNGAHHLDKGRLDKEQEELFLGQAERVEAFCSQYGYPLLRVDSNLQECLASLLWYDSFHRTHIYRNVGITLLFQKLIKVYYYSSTYKPNDFSCSLLIDPAHYEKYLLPHLSTENTTFYSSNECMTRLEKTEYISSFPQSYDHLLVCFMSKYNCGHCLKCKRTLLTLDALGILELYKNSFDLEDYRKNREQFLREFCVEKEKDDLLREIYDYNLKNGDKLSVKTVEQELQAAARKAENENAEKKPEPQPSDEKRTAKELIKAIRRKMRDS